MANIKWDRESDIIVIGAGNAGLPAAIAAADKGMKVIVLEAWKSGSASSLPMIASGTPFAGTDFQKERNVPDSRKFYMKKRSDSAGAEKTSGELSLITNWNVMNG